MTISPTKEPVPTIVSQLTWADMPEQATELDLGPEGLSRSIATTALLALVVASLILLLVL